LSDFSVIRPLAASTLTTVPVTRARAGATGAWALKPTQNSVVKTMTARDFITLIKTWKVPKFMGVVALLKVTRGEGSYQAGSNDKKAAAACRCSRLSGNTKLEWAADYAVVLAAVVFFVLVGFVLVVFLVVVVEASSAKTTTVVPRNAKPSIRVINLFILCGSPLEGWTISSSWVYHPSPT
jgi:hypothetical protein